MKTLSHWILGGALAASLTWNWTQQRRAEARMGRAAASRCELTACALPGSASELDPERERALAELCATSCAESDRLEQRANALQQELLASLAAEHVDEATTGRLVDEVSELRRHSLAACVQGILGVRKVLTGDEVRALLERCEHGAASCRQGPEGLLDLK